MQTKYRFLETDSEGKPCHLHTYDGVPMTGGSSVVGVLSKELTFWSAGLAVKEFSGIEDCKVLTKMKKGQATAEEMKDISDKVGEWLAKHKGISTSEYVALCQKAYNAHATRLDDSAQAGTDMHSLLETYVKSCIEKNQGTPLAHSVGETEQVSDFVNWSMKEVGRFIASEAHCFDEDLFVGGIFDACCEMKDGIYAILDFKSAKAVYLSHFIQIAIYNILIEKNGLVDKNGLEVMRLDKPITQYIVCPFGAKVFIPVLNKNVEELKKAGLACVELYRIKNKFEN